jgi:Domain of unknown function (DUF5668)
MRLNNRLAGWGVFLILLGAIPLLVRQGVLSSETVSRSWNLWPLLLIAAGIGLLLRRTQFAFVGGLLAAATMGILGGALLAGGFGSFGCGGGEDGSPFPARQGDLGASATVDLTQTCGDLTVVTAGGTAWRVQGDSSDSPPTVDSAADRLAVSSAERGGFAVNRSSADWTVTLPASPRLGLRAQVNAGTGSFNLANANLDQLAVTVNAGTLTLDLSHVASIARLAVQMNAVGNSRILLPNLALAGSIDANAAGNIRLCPPAGAGLRLTTNDNITATNNYAARGLVQAGNAWQTPGYESAAVRIDLATRANAGGFNLEAAGTCGG